MTDTTTTTSAQFGADALIVCDNLVRIYQVEDIEVQALQGLDLLIDQGEMIAIIGQSGSGKSTLLNVLSGLDVPTAGAARVGGWDLLRMSASDRLTYRREVVGFVWQQTARNLLPYLSARENVMLPMAFAGLGGRKRVKRANELLDAMGLGEKAGRRPGQLSGGEQQRVAIAVAMANNPKVLFADEPTGELDSATGHDVFEALRAANRDLGATVVIVTHDDAVSNEVQRTVAIRDGRTATEKVRSTRVNEHGHSEVVHEEYAVLDRAGRMQLPKDYREGLQLKDRVRLELESDHIGIWAEGTRANPNPVPADAPAPMAPPAGMAPPMAPPSEVPAAMAPPAGPSVHFAEAAARPSPEEQVAASASPVDGLTDVALQLAAEDDASYAPAVAPGAPADAEQAPVAFSPYAAPAPADDADDDTPPTPWAPVKGDQA